MQLSVHQLTMILTSKGDDMSNSKVVTFGAGKGGVGKSTGATNFAAWLQQKGKSVVLVELDVQGASTSFCNIRHSNGDVKDIPFINLVLPQNPDINDMDDMRVSIAKLKESYDVVILDAVGADSPELRIAALMSNVVMSPIEPQGFSMLSLTKTLETLSKAMQRNTEMQVCFYLSRCSTHAISREMSSAKDLFSSLDNVKLMNSAICQRMSINRASLEGKSVFEYTPTDEKAVIEFSSLFKQLEMIAGGF